MKHIHLKTVDSTNTYIRKYLTAREDVLVTAEEQTAGRGTKGRGFSSQSGGVYLSCLRFYRDFPATRYFSVMTDSAVAVCRTLESFGLQAEIKWPNDVFVQGKKICGILIENSFSGQNLSYSIVGIGLNVQNDLPPDLADVATTMRLAAGRTWNTDEVCRILAENLAKTYSMQEYVSYIRFLGQAVRIVYPNGKEETVLPTGIGDTGELELSDGRTLAAAEVSLRFFADMRKK